MPQCHLSPQSQKRVQPKLPMDSTALLRTWLLPDPWLDCGGGAEPNPTYLPPWLGGNPAGLHKPNAR